MDKNGKLKLIIIFFLSLILIVLLYFYLSGNKDSTNKESELISPVQNTKEKITKDLDSIFFTFGLRKEWIREASGKDSKNKTPLFSKEVMIPLDLPVIELNHEITNYLQNKGLSNKVTEDPKTKNINMDIVSAKDSMMITFGNVKLIYSDSVKRNAAVVCIILDSIDSYSLDDVEKILNSTQQYSVFLPTRNDKADYQSKISELKRDYLIKLFIGNENDIEADFRDDMKESIWKSKVKTLYLSFPLLTGLIFTHKNGLNDFEEELTREFTKNNIEVYSDTMIMRLKSDTGKVNSLLEDIISKSGSGKKFLIYGINFNPSEFSEYDNKIHDLKKSGFKFVTFKDLMKYRNKIETKSAVNTDSTKNENKK